MQSTGSRGKAAVLRDGHERSQLTDLHALIRSRCHDGYVGGYKRRLWPLP